MKLTHVKNFDFNDDPDIPRELFKYRDWSIENHKSILIEQELFLAPPDSFEDPMDCKLQKRYDLMSEKDIYNLYLKISKREHPERTRNEHRSYATMWTKKSPLKDKFYIKKQQENHFDEFNKRFGVLSLTGDSENKEMWNKYADNGKGICVGFDSFELFKHVGGGGKVQYTKELPVINHDDDNMTEQIKQVFFKEEIWSFEKEYRTHKFSGKVMSLDDRIIKVPKNIIKSVAFGWDVPENNINEIKRICDEQDLNVSYRIQSA